MSFVPFCPPGLLGVSFPGGPEWIIILVIALLIFGARLPKIMRSLGGSVREFKKGIDEGVEDDDEQDNRKVEERRTEHREDEYSRDERDADERDERRL